MKKVVVSIPEKMQEELARFKKDKDENMSDAEWYQYLIQLGLDIVHKKEAKEEGD